jgi:glutathione S-transferase
LRIILEFLDERAGGGRIVPREASARLAALRLQALSDGILDASILAVYEARWRAAEHHEQKWLDHQAGKVTRALAAHETDPPTLGDGVKSVPNVGQIALACALGYRGFRFGESWRADDARLARWLDDFAARVPSFAATKPTG